MKNLMWSKLFWLCIKTAFGGIFFVMIGCSKLAAIMVVAAFFMLISSEVSMFVWAFKA